MVNVIGVRLFVTTTKEPRVNVVVFKAFWSTTNNGHGLRIKFLSQTKIKGIENNHCFGNIFKLT
jgi:hypothetical protein